MTARLITALFDVNQRQDANFQAPTKELAAQRELTPVKIHQRRE
jgi:hypothetical protein